MTENEAKTLSLIEKLEQLLTQERRRGMWQGVFLCVLTWLALDLAHWMGAHGL